MKITINNVTSVEQLEILMASLIDEFNNKDDYYYEEQADGNYFTYVQKKRNLEVYCAKDEDELDRLTSHISFVQTSFPYNDSENE